MLGFSFSIPISIPCWSTDAAHRNEDVREVAGVDLVEDHSYDPSSWVWFGRGR